MEFSETSESLLFCCQEINPFIMHVIINNDEVIEVTLYGAGSHGAGQVYVNKAKWFSLAMSRDRKFMSC